MTDHGAAAAGTSATSSSLLSRAPTWGVWDQKTQTFHAGQEWKFIPNYVEDFSVTTNALGTPESGLAAASEVCVVGVGLCELVGGPE